MIGRSGWVRSKAWTWVLSSIESTTVPPGGSKSSPRRCGRSIRRRPCEAAAAALDALDEGEVGRRYPAIPRVWRAAWDEFTPFLAYPLEIRRVLYITNMIESLNVRLRKATRNRSAFPSEQAALKTLYHTVRTMTRPDGAVGITCSNGWKATLNAFAIQS